MKYVFITVGVCLLSTFAAVAIIATRDVKTENGVTEPHRSAPASGNSDAKKDDLSNLTFK